MSDDRLNGPTAVLRHDAVGPSQGRLGRSSVLPAAGAQAQGGLSTARHAYGRCTSWGCTVRALFSLPARRCGEVKCIVHVLSYQNEAASDDDVNHDDVSIQQQSAPSRVRVLLVQLVCLWARGALRLHNIHTSERLRCPTSPPPAPGHPLARRLPKVLSHPDSFATAPLRCAGPTLA